MRNTTDRRKICELAQMAKNGIDLVDSHGSGWRIGGHHRVSADYRRDYAGRI